MDFRIGEGVCRAAAAPPYRPRPGDPLYRPLRVFALDAAASRLDGGEVVARVPYERLEPGPRGALFQVDCRDYPLADLDQPELLLGQGLVPSPSDPRFHPQMVYAVASLVHAAFRRALGRDLAWGFRPPADGRTRLLLRPFAAEDRNAWYDPDSGEVCFGYYRADPRVRGRNLPGGWVFTALCHDIIVHETSHALLDGLRSQFTVPTGPDVLAFHEGFADLLAVFQHFSHPELLLAAIRRARGRMDQAGLLAELARQFGHTTGAGGPLRSAIDPDPDTPGLYDPALAPHALGSVLVSAVFEAFATVYTRRTERYLRLATGGSGVLPPGELAADLQRLLAEEAARLAGQFATLCIRAVDYCPPVDLRLGEFLRAVLTADRELVPDDPWGYREAWIDAFARRRIYPPGVASLAEDALLWRPPERPLPPLPELHFGRLRFAGDPGCAPNRDELLRQARALGAYVSRPEHRAAFGLAGPGPGVGPPCVQSIRALRRAGPGGRVVFDLVAEITQTHEAGGPGGAFQVLAGATVVLGPEGEPRYVIYKRGEREGRAAEQQAYLGGPGRRWWRQEGGRWRPAARLFRLLHSG